MTVPKLQQPPVSDSNIASLNWMGWFLKLWKYVMSLPTTSGGGGASTAEKFVTIGNTAGLSAERALTAGTGIAIVDNGPNSTVVISTSGGAGASTFDWGKYIAGKGCPI